jgi:hypothetical protein
VDRRERERILRESGVREPNTAEQTVVRRLAEDLQGSPLQGRPLPRRLRNFRPSVEGYVASQGGALPYMARLREIEAETDAHEQRLADAWRALAASSGGDARRFADRWRETASRWNFSEVNDLIARHNRWFPVEARLPMDPRTGDFVLVAGKPYRRAPLDETWVLERFPPSLARAAA